MADTLVMLGYCAVAGIGTVMISLSVLHFFAVHLNGQNGVAKFLSDAQYGVYVCQTMTVPVVMFTFIKLLEASGRSIQFSPCENEPLNPNHIEDRVVAREGETYTIMIMQLSVSICSYQPISQSIIIAGWLYTIAFVNLISWPLAYYIRKLPGFKEVL
jgi:hypothetical protein